MERTKFEVLREIDNTLPENIITTAHWSQERTERHNKVVEQLGEGTLITAFLVDTGHPNGYEIHNIMSNGLILIQNERTQKLITELIARPAQLTRYWSGLHMQFPPGLYHMLTQARSNEMLNRNNW